MRRECWLFSAALLAADAAAKVAGMADRQAEVDPVSDDATTRPAPRPEVGRPRSGSSGLLAVFLGGLVAGGIGYLAAYYTEFAVFETGDGADSLEQISATLEEQSQRLGALESMGENTPVAGPDEELQGQLGEVANRIASISDRIEAIEGAPGTDPEAREQAQAASQSLTSLQERLAALEEQTGDPGTTETDASQSQQLSEQSDRLASLSQQVDELSQTVQSQSQIIDDQAAQLQSQAQTIDEQSGRIEEAQATARTETNRISAQAALAEIRAAMDAGNPYADAIGQLQGAGGPEVPQALSGPAGSGVPSLSDLRDSFGQPAREALSSSIAATTGGGAIDRIGAFLKSQTGARSLGEQEGDGPDAILSQAEARLGEGDLQAALDTLQALPQEGQEAMSDWIERARTRLDAQNALADLSQSVNTN